MIQVIFSIIITIAIAYFGYINAMNKRNKGEKENERF